MADCIDPKLEPGVVRYFGGLDRHQWRLRSLETLGQMVIDDGFVSVELRMVYALATKAEKRGHWRASLVATV